MRLHSGVEIRAARYHQPQLLCHCLIFLLHLGGILGVVALDAVQPALLEVGEEITQRGVLHLDKMQVSDERKTAAVFNELHRLLRREILDIGIGVFAVFKIELEALLDARGVALVDKQPCEMRPADYAVRRKGESLLHRDVEAQLVELAAAFAHPEISRLVDLIEGLLEQRGINVEIICKDMCLSSGLHGEFNRGHNLNAYAFALLHGLLNAVHRIVIREGYSAEPCFLCLTHHLGGGH